MDKDDVKNELKKIGEINDAALMFPIWGTCVMPGISANLLTSKRDARFIVLSEDFYYRKFTFQDCGSDYFSVRQGWRA